MQQVKIFFKKESNKYVFRYTKAERIHHQQTESLANVKEIPQAKEK